MKLIQIFKKTYEGFEDIVDLERDISEMWDETINPVVKDIPAEFQGSVQVRILYVPYISPLEKLMDMVEFSALPTDKEELISFLKSLKEK